MQELSCQACGAMVMAPEGPVFVRHHGDGSHDCVRVDGTSSLWTSRERGVELPAGGAGGESEMASEYDRAAWDRDRGIDAAIGKLGSRLDQLEVQVSSIVVRDLAALMLRVSQLEGWATGGDAVSHTNMDERIRNLEQVFKLRAELRD